MDHFQFFQSPVAAAREWWYNSVWKGNPYDDDDDEMEDRLKDSADETSSQYSENVVVLKVGIHCEECKRIVGDALWNMQGVDQVDVDKLRQKVTVTGKVSTKRVIRTVQRTGKCVELWKIGGDSKRESSSEPSDAHSHGVGSAISAADEEEEEEALCVIM